MKKIFLLFILCGLLSVNQSIAQCGQISMIGEFTGWAGDFNMIRDLDTFDLWVQSVVFTIDDDLDGSGFVDMKFRENADWTNNWGSVDFPSGTGLLNGPNIQVPYGAWNVSFNCFTLEYNFQVQIGVDENPVNNELMRIRPNPASTDITLDLAPGSELDNASISLYNMNGQELLKHRLTDLKTVIDISALKAGVYFVKMTGEKSIAIEKLIKID
jgi:hypothetical protein